MLVIRQPKEGEAATLGALEQLCFPAGEAATPAEMQDRFQAFPDNFLVAERDGVIRGYIDGVSSSQCRISPSMFHDTSLHEPEGEYLLVFGVGVHPNARQAGLAGMLLKSFVSMARKRGMKGVGLHCKEYMVRYYTRLGFEDLGPGQTGSGHDMLLRLEADSGKPKEGAPD